MVQELKIAMMGARGVGKTSLLTAMYEQFGKTIGQTGLQLTPDQESSAILQERLGELKALVDNFEATGGLEGDSELRSYIFDLGKKGAKPSLRLNFQDFPGTWLSSKATKEQQESVTKLLENSVAILIAIDTPALMEVKGKWHELQNRPKQIKDLFASVYQEMKLPRLVIFAPVRCEKYMQTTKDATSLLKSIKEGYADLLSLFGAENLNPWVTSVVTPVQTVGTVVFSRIEIEKDGPHFYFRKISNEVEYDPQDSDQPLRYLLRFVLKLHLAQKKSRWLGLAGIFQEFLGMNEHLKSAIIQSSQGCKTTTGFTVLQGQNWLDIK
ncbi:hypothetical protein [Okeania sp. SIO2B9]|uniref:TRAFAC clade GTPase domain-containing protein n=1 Tax=Microcoleaceae TaxID=1892252 RepID=UPI00142A89A4|nr:hypothetical protein [Okeania sp. SIO2B9]NES88950.1 hypothetical protein [Okeania sp. SIO2B9]